MISVLVVEDSRVTRDYLVFVLESDPAIEVVGAVDSGEAALEFIARRRPDVILMDIHLPGIDGIETTRRLMTTTPVPVVMCTSSLGSNEVHTALRGLEAGALALLKKPRGLADPESARESAAIVSSLKLMSEIRVVRRWHRPSSSGQTLAVVAQDNQVDRAAHDAAVVVIGASTGGPPALVQILTALPRDFPVPILIVQHISAGFAAGLCTWLAAASGLPVNMACAGQVPLPGHVYVAPDDHHMRVGPRGELQLAQDPPQHGLRPTIGPLFKSVAQRYGRRAIGVLLTGMGRDGADELKEMADMGALTMAQDEASCVVFGMPAEAIRLGAARHVASPTKIAELLSAAVPAVGKIAGGTHG